MEHVRDAVVEYLALLTPNPNRNPNPNPNPAHVARHGTHPNPNPNPNPKTLTWPVTGHTMVERKRPSNRSATCESLRLRWRWSTSAATWLG